MGTCWQYIQRQKFAAEGLPAGLQPDQLKPRLAHVARISKDQARAVILKYEWLGTMAQTGLHYGIFYGDHLAGVTCVNVGGAGAAGVNSHKEFNLQRDQVAYLARGACVHWAPTGTNSRLVSITARMVAKDSAAKVLLAYADPAAGEIGTIYQACNWYYIGRTWPGRRWVSPDGQKDRDWKYPYDLKKQRGKTRKHWADWLKAQGWTVKVLQPKYKYVAILDKGDPDLLKLIKGKTQAYPKKV